MYDKRQPMPRERAAWTRGAATALASLLMLIVVVCSPVRADDQVAALLTGWMQNFTPSTPGRPAPTAAFEHVAGGERTVADYAGSIVVLNFFATWCAPCRHEMPSLDRLQAALGGQGVVVVIVSEDRLGFGVVTPFLAEIDVKHLDEVLLDKSMRGVRSLRVLGLPTTIVYGADGAELGRLAGPAEWDSPEAVALLRHFIARADVSS